MKATAEFFRKHFFVSIISLILIIVPFFWMKPGEMDLGGDATRLYFYDPLAYLLKYALFYFDGSIEGVRVYDPTFYNIPFVGLLVLLKSFIPSSYFLIAIFNGIKLAGGFIFVYFIVKEYIQKLDKKDYYIGEMAAVLGGLFYIASPAMIENYDKALLSQNQVFLNPLLFYLLLKYLLTKNYRFLWVILLVTLLFAPNFSWASAPPFFAFFPLAIVFLLVYVRFIRKEKLPIKGIIVGGLVFLGLHLFHLIPQMTTLLGSNSYINERVFNKNNIAEQINYFYAVLSSPKVSTYFFADSTTKYFHFLAVLSPLIIVLGVLFNKSKNKTILLSFLFFLLTLFLVVAKITDLGPYFYSKLFYLPGFTMFRNFTGQWQFVYFFFYALVFGQAAYIVLKLFRKKYIYILFFVLSSFFLLSSWQFITGQLVNKTLFQSKDVKIALQMDNNYEDLISYINNIPSSGNILSFPFSDCCYSVVHGKNNGAYVGPSPLNYLTNKKDFSGYLLTSPFSDAFIEAAKKKDYASMKRIMALLNVQYIFHNSDPLVYDTTFPGYPFEYMRQYLPKNQKEYAVFIKPLVGKEIFSERNIHLYEVNEDAILPHLYIAKNLVTYESNPEDKAYNKANSFSKQLLTKEVRTAYIDKENCLKVSLGTLCDDTNKYSQQIPQIYFEKISPLKYKVKVNNANQPYLLVLSSVNHPAWKVFLSPKNATPENASTAYFNNDIKENKNRGAVVDTNLFETNNMKEISNSRHIVANGYANAWVITPEDTGSKKSYELIVEMADQKTFFIALFSSGILFILFLAWGFRLFFQDIFDIMKKRNK